VASAEGYETERSSTFGVRQNDTATVNLRLHPQAPPTSAITGLVSDASNDEVIQDAQVILLRDTDDSFGTQWSAQDTVRTNKEGIYIFENIPASTRRQPYSVEVVKEGYRTNREESITVGDGDTVTVDVALGLITTGTLNVFVGKESDDSPLEGAAVSAVLSEDEAVVYTGTTGSEGWVQFETVLTGNYTITASSSGFRTETARREITEDENDSAYVLLAESEEYGNVVMGTVTDSEEKAVEGVAVVIRGGFTNAAVVLFDTTNADGEYVISGIPSFINRFEITATHEEYEDYSSTVNVNDDTVTVDISLNKTTTSVQKPITSGSGVNHPYILSTGLNTLEIINAKGGVVSIYLFDGRLVFRQYIGSVREVVRYPDIHRRLLSKPSIAVITNKSNRYTQTLFRVK
jgi:hypothetical protein